jgi:CRP-like cAMP-binding protein
MLGKADEYMKTLDLFAGFSPAELDMLGMVFTVRALQEGEMLCTEGDTYASFFVVVSGQIASFKRTRSGRLDLGRTGPNSLLGHKSLIQGGKRSCSMIASQPSLVLECNRADFQNLFQANSPFAYKVMDVVVNDLVGLLRKVDGTLDRLISSPDEGLSTELDALLAGGLRSR